MDTNKRFLLALILSFLFVYIYTGIVFKKYSNEKPDFASGETKIELNTQKFSFSPFEVTGDRFEVSTNSLIFDIFKQGGVISNVRLKIKKKNSEPVELLSLIDSSNKSSLFGIFRNSQPDTSEYNVISDVTTPEYREIILRSNEGFEKKFRFLNEGYLAEVSISGLNDGESVALMGFQGETETRLNVHKYVTLDLTRKIHRSSFNSGISGNYLGAGFDSLYFSIFLLSQNNAIQVSSYYESLPTIFLKPVNGSKLFEFKVFIGPKEIRVLESLGDPFNKILDLGFFAVLADPILRALLWLGDYFENYGLAIVLLTVIIRMVLFPLNSMSYKAMEKLKEIQPEIDRLRKEFGNDPQTLNRELLALYQKKGVNPFSGCLPIFVQIPIFFGLYSALLHAFELRQAKFFGWITDLSKTDYVSLGPIPIPVLTLIFGASFIYIQKLNPPQFTDPAQEQVFKWFPYIILVMFIIFPMPSGLVLYWLINNLSSIAQILISKRWGFNKSFLLNLSVNVVIVLIAYFLTLLF